MGLFSGSSSQGSPFPHGAPFQRSTGTLDRASRHQIWDLDTNHVQATQGQVFYTYSKGEASSSNIRSMVNNLDAFARETKLPIGYVLHLVSSAKPPASEDRELTTAMFNRHAGRITGLAVVIEADGFTGAALRSAVTMVFMMTCRGFPTRTFPNIRAAADWLAERQRVPAAEIIRLSEEAHGALRRAGT
ncbi:MAG TPA: hypothetical protein VFQ61_31765 [Polyangiaceae bacterium]|nr:hypothetical protein [Polyangiaceae bacterium]